MPSDLTVGELGRQSGLSRSTLLYYDRLGLLRPVNRSRGNYRLYAPSDAERLKQICFYRKMGIALRDIARLLDQADEAGPTERILQHRLEALDREIESKENSVVNKQRWIEIMTAAGFSDQDMRNWHRTFEKMEPQGHQEFLESLGIGVDEIARIREWSRG